MSSFPPTDRGPDRDVVARLGAVLDAVQAGDLRDWHPLPDQASRDDLLSVRPAAEPARDLTTLLGQPAIGYRLPPTPHAPGGVAVWTQHDEVTLIDVPGPDLVAGYLEVLGPPEAILESGIGDSLEQRLWPQQGLILHVARATGRVARLYGHHVATVAQMRTSPLVNVRIERHRR